MKTLREIEPFAFGFKEADVSGVDPKYERNYRIACGFKAFMEKCEISINPADWFAGPCCEFPNMGIHYSRGGGIESDPNIRNNQKKRFPYLADEIDVLYDEFEPIRTFRLTGEVFTNNHFKLMDNNCCWGAGSGHANPDYEMLLRIGTNGIREKINLFKKIHTDKKSFYDSLEIALSALEILAERYRILAEKMIETASENDAKILKRIASAFQNIPQNQPRDFFEACQFFWLAYSFIDNDSPGLFDYALGRYYEKHDEQDRYKCLEKLWELFYKVRAWNLCIGGSDEFYNDRCCELTYDILRVAREKHYTTPNITMRFHKNSPERAWKEAVETIATGIGMPAIYNDECVCPALEAIGIPASDAHLYCMNGCNQIDIFGKSHMGLEDGEISVIKALEFALFDGVCQKCFEKIGLSTGNADEFDSFEKLLNAFYKQTDFLTDTVVEISNYAQRVFAEHAPNPWHSLVIQGCIEKGLDYKNRGPYYGHAQILTEGLPDAADSLATIKHFVFDEKKYTMSQLKDALQSDFKGYENMQKDLYSYDKFGNDIDDVDRIYAEITDHIYRYGQTKSAFRGGKFGFGCSTFERAARYGASVGALPNGRHRDDSTLADSIGAVPGCDENGPTALLNSVLKANQFLATSGNVLQMKFQKNQFNTPTGIMSFIALAKTYFRLGGQTLQVNVLSADELKEAKKNPEKYKNLIVRVGGFSDYFVELEEGLQDNIIKRTEQVM
ncbi:MAG: hypothetical protein MJ120_05240 [Clostridia bacterium]|nr:hypothetical protein [Clostridia bacterium]